jgi:hypothetical protein
MPSHPSKEPPAPAGAFVHRGGAVAVAVSVFIFVLVLVAIYLLKHLFSHRMCMPLPDHLHTASIPSPVLRKLMPMSGTDSGFRLSSSILGTSTSQSLQEPHSAYICDSCV